MKRVALIVAAGRGLRAGDGAPKQYRRLAGRSVLARSIAAFAEHEQVDRIRVVIHPDHRDLYEAAIEPHVKLLAPVSGGGTRQQSVALGLESLIDQGADQVLIHDAARPFVAPETISAVIAALDAHPAAIPGIRAVDTMCKEDGTPVPREGVWRVQTPQAFHFFAIYSAHQLARQSPDGTEHTDDSEVARRAGVAIHMVKGRDDNRKLTTAEDFRAAEQHLVAREAPGILMPRIGQGVDVHRFGPGDHVMLCGVRVEHGQGLVAHSDGDVGLHAITDALLGTMALGDIGQHFPPSKPEWQGVDSAYFLAHSCTLLKERGGRVGNIDVTLICEQPKIGPHVDRMRARVAEICGIRPVQVSIKATTSEGLGFTGRKEGIAAMANAVVIMEEK